jgi:hypothetical protein
LDINFFQPRFLGFPVFRIPGSGIQFQFSILRKHCMMQGYRKSCCFDFLAANTKMNGVLRDEVPKKKS